MKAVCFQDIQQVSTLDIADPKIENRRDAIVQVSLAGLCGSDLHPYFGRETGIDIGTVMGHELVGTIVEVGSEIKGCDSLSVGDRVCAPFSTNCGTCYFCQHQLPSRCVEGQLFGWRENGVGLHGCQSELVRVPLADSTLMKIPDSVNDTDALLLGDNFSTGYYCAEMAGIKPGGTYAVIGCGTVGQLCIVAAKQMGAETLFAIDLEPDRLRQAEVLGGIAVTPDADGIETIMAATNGRGVDAVMELVGLPAAQKLAYQLIRPGGVMSVIGCHCTPHFAFGPIDAYDKNLTYRTGRCPARYYMERLAPQVIDGTFDLSRFVTHEFDLSDSQQAYTQFSSHQDGCLKAVFRC